MDVLGNDRNRTLIEVGKTFSDLISTTKTEFVLVLKGLTAVLLDDFKILTYGNVFDSSTDFGSFGDGWKGIVTGCQRVSLFNLSKEFTY